MCRTRFFLIFEKNFLVSFVFCLFLSLSHTVVSMIDTIDGDGFAEVVDGSEVEDVCVGTVETYQLLLRKRFSGVDTNSFETGPVPIDVPWGLCAKSFDESAQIFESKCRHYWGAADSCSGSEGSNTHCLALNYR